MGLLSLLLRFYKQITLVERVFNKAHGRVINDAKSCVMACICHEYSPNCHKVRSVDANGEFKRARMIEWHAWTWAMPREHNELRPGRDSFIRAA